MRHFVICVIFCKFIVYLNDPEMPRQPRQRSVTGVYHVIQRGINHILIFFEDADRLMFIKLLELQVCETFKVYCYCLMDNHLHLIVKSDRLSFYFHRIFTIYASWFNQKYEREGYLFQNRFKSEVIEDEGYLLRCCRYVLQNPLKAGLCSKVSEYRWSSYSAYFNPAGSFVCTEFLPLFFARREDFQSYIGEEDTATFMDIGYQLKDGEVRKLWEDMMEGKSVESLTKPELKQILRKLLQNPGIAKRQLARITGIDVNIIRRLY